MFVQCNMPKEVLHVTWLDYHARPLPSHHSKVLIMHNMSLIMKKLAFFIWENNDADQLPSYCAADQRLCFRYTDSTIHLLPKSEISTL